VVLAWQRHRAANQPAKYFMAEAAAGEAAGGDSL